MVQSGFMFISICNEALGMSIDEILDSDYALITSVLRERNFTINQRNKEMSSEDPNKEYEEITDFETGKIKRVEVSRNM